MINAYHECWSCGHSWEDNRIIVKPCPKCGKSHDFRKVYRDATLPVDAQRDERPRTEKTSTQS